MENSILIYKNESDQIVLEEIIKGRKISSSLYPNLSNTLEGNAECSARLLYYHGLRFGDYQVRNGKKWNPLKGIIDANEVDARTYSNINFAILNEMMKLTEQKRLEERAA